MSQGTGRAQNLLLMVPSLCFSLHTATVGALINGALLALFCFHVGSSDNFGWGSWGLSETSWKASVFRDTSVVDPSVPPRSWQPGTGGCSDADWSSGVVGLEMRYNAWLSVNSHSSGWDASIHKLTSVFSLS